MDSTACCKNGKIHKKVVEGLIPVCYNGKVKGGGCFATENDADQH